MLVLSFIILGENIKKLAFLLKRESSCLYVTNEKVIMTFMSSSTCEFFLKTFLLEWK